MQSSTALVSSLLEKGTAFFSSSFLFLHCFLILKRFEQVHLNHPKSVLEVGLSNFLVHTFIADAPSSASGTERVPAKPVALSFVITLNHSN